MATQLTPLLLQLLLNQNPLSNLLQQNHQNNLFQTTQQMVHSQLLQTILQQKLKNEILLNVLLSNSKGLDENKLLQRNSSLQGNLKNVSVLQNITKIEAMSDQQCNKQNKNQKYEPNSTELLEQKKSKIGTVKKIKNETKNIPKNYGKAIISFIQKNDHLVKRILSKCQKCDYSAFMLDIRRKKKKLNSIADLRSLWLDSQNPYAKPLRILSLIFFKQHSFPYIFNSRVTNYKGHIKYRYRLIEALRNPQKFTSIKIF